MSIVLSAIVPHPPLIIPFIGKENTERLKNTIQAYGKLEEYIYTSHIDTIVIISPHGFIQPNSFSINLNPKFIGDFEEFGDCTTEVKLNGNIGLAYKIRERLETRAPIQSITTEKLDYGSSVPLYNLTKHLPGMRIIPIYYSGLDLESHYNFGKLLKRELVLSNNRVAVIASGDLSHRLSKDAPSGYSPKAKKFDKKLIEYLSNSKIKDILNMNHDLIHDACECGLKSIVMLLGILNSINNKPEILSYEAPFGVGYLVMNFKL